MFPVQIAQTNFTNVVTLINFKEVSYLKYVTVNFVIIVWDNDLIKSYNSWQVLLYNYLFWENSRIIKQFSELFHEIFPLLFQDKINLHQSLQILTKNRARLFLQESTFFVFHKSHRVYSSLTEIIVNFTQTLNYLWVSYGCSLMFEFITYDTILRWLHSFIDSSEFDFWR